MPGIGESPGQIRPDPEPSPDLPATKRSRACPLNDGSQKHYPTLDDYLAHLVHLGIVKDLDDLVCNYGHLIGEIFFNWVQTGQLACLFAVRLAKKPRENRWFPIVQLRALEEGAALGALLNTQLDAASTQNEAAAIIFPDVVGEDAITALVNALCADPSGRWYWTNDGITEDSTGALKLVGLRWILPGDKNVNYVLGFSSIVTMPQTRHSPFTTLFLRIKDFKRSEVRTEDGRIQVHLADLDSTFHPQEVHDHVSDLTKKTRTLHVEPHLIAAAKARVTFAISSQAAKSLCAMRHVSLEK
jgi:hypothetical protein